MRLFSEVRERLRALFFRAREEREMEAEMRFHLDMETERLAREERLPPEEAHRRAAVAFGGEERFKEEVREARGVAWLEHLLQDVRYGLRSLRRAPALTLVVVVTLALGIGATTTLFTIVNAVLLRPLPYPHADRIVSISEAQGGRDGQIVAVPDFAEWERSSRSDELRITIPSPQYAQKWLRLRNRYGVTTTGSNSAVRIGPRPGHVFTSCHSRCLHASFSSAFSALAFKPASASCSAYSNSARGRVGRGNASSQRSRSTFA